jgi:hypothetical protein
MVSKKKAEKVTPRSSEKRKEKGKKNKTKHNQERNQPGNLYGRNVEQMEMKRALPVGPTI